MSSIASMIQLQETIDAAGLEKDTQDVLFKAFGPHFKDMVAEINKAKDISVTDESQTEAMKAAKLARKALVTVRTATEKTRTAVKADALKFGTATDNVARMIRLKCEEFEKRLEEAETFKERAEAKRREERRVQRVAALAEFGTDIRFMDLAIMDDEAWNALYKREQEALAGRQAKAKADAEAAEKAEADRRAEAAKLREENERLRKEQAERNAKEADERRKADAELAERRRKMEEEIAEHRAKVEADARELAAKLRDQQERIDRENAERERVEREEAERKEAEDRRIRAEQNAPDADKLQAVALALRSIEYPQVGDRAQQVIDRVRQGAEKMAAFVEQQASLLASGAA